MYSWIEKKPASLISLSVLLMWMPTTGSSFWYSPSLYSCFNRLSSDATLAWGLIIYLAIWDTHQTYCFGVISHQPTRRFYQVLVGGSVKALWYSMQLSLWSFCIHDNSYLRCFVKAYQLFSNVRRYCRWHVIRPKLIKIYTLKHELFFSTGFAETFIFPPEF